MYFVEYLDYDMAGELNPPVGDRNIVILDGRKSIRNMKKDAIKLNGQGRQFYPAFKICKGESFIRSKYITEIIYLTEY